MAAVVIYVINDRNENRRQIITDIVNSNSYRPPNTASEEVTSLLSVESAALHKAQIDRHNISARPLELLFSSGKFLELHRVLEQCQEIMTMMGEGLTSAERSVCEFQGQVIGTYGPTALYILKTAVEAGCTQLYADYARALIDEPVSPSAESPGALLEQKDSLLRMYGHFVSAGMAGEPEGLRAAAIIRVHSSDQDGLKDAIALLKLIPEDSRSDFIKFELMEYEKLYRSQIDARRNRADSLQTTP